jgi:intracellular septation protein
MKLFLDFLPIILFFGTYQFTKFNKDWAAAFATQHLGFAVAGGVVGAEEAPVMLATVVVVFATLVQVVWLKAARRKIDLMLWISLVLVVLLGGATVWFHDPMFIKWKPSIAFWIMGLVFWASRTFFHKNILRMTLGEELHLPDAVWQRLHFGWIAFFALMGLLNLWVAYAFSTDVWANFHTFGTYALMGAFIVWQAFYLSPYLKEDEQPARADGQPASKERSL